MFNTAREDGAKAGAEVLAGRLTPEEAGDLWVAVADRSHTAGVAWMRGYDGSGAPR